VAEVHTPEADAVKWPETLQFRQLTFSHRNQLPALSSHMIEQYFSDTPTAVGCIKSVEKGQKLMDAGKVAGCSFAISENQNSSLYFTGFVQAAMKKKVTREEYFSPVRFLFVIILLLGG